MSTSAGQPWRGPGPAQPWTEISPTGYTSSSSFSSFSSFRMDVDGTKQDHHRAPNPAAASNDEDGGVAPPQQPQQQQQQQHSPIVLPRPPAPPAHIPPHGAPVRWVGWLRKESGAQSRAAGRSMTYGVVLQVPIRPSSAFGGAFGSMTFSRD